MYRSPELLAKALNLALSSHGSIADFCKKAGFTYPTVQHWRNLERSPTLENLDRIAMALGVQPWELIKPYGAEATPIPRPVLNLSDSIQEAIRKSLKEELTPIVQMLAILEQKIPTKR